MAKIKNHDKKCARIQNASWGMQESEQLSPIKSSLNN